MSCRRTWSRAGSRPCCAELNRYPDGEARRAKQRLREFMQVPAESELLLGNGSDELIQMLLLALARPGRGAGAVPTFRTN